MTLPMIMANNNPLVLSLFPGADLLGLAFELEGFTVVQGPDVIFGRDIRNFHPPAGKFDGVIGGPPCQSFSPLVHLLRATGKAPRHGNLIPEYERCVREAQPDWFLMENVTAAPEPIVSGYSVSCLLLCPTWLGEAQQRKRRFSFGVPGGAAVNLWPFIEYAALELPDTARFFTRGPLMDNSDEAKGRVKQLAVTGDSRAVPVAIGGSGKVKQRTVRGKNDGNPQPWEIANGRGAGYKRTWAECCELQGVPADFLDDAPFTSDGKKTLLGNGVPIALGRAIAKAVTRALASEAATGEGVGG
jgi:DNA (cytosine-5)-methyltransferase 1